MLGHLPGEGEALRLILGIEKHFFSFVFFHFIRIINKVAGPEWDLEWRKFLLWALHPSLCDHRPQT